MSRILILYSTVDGHTLRICERLRATLGLAGHEVLLSDLDSPAPADLRSFDKIAIGASVRYGKHRPNVATFLLEHRAVLLEKPTALFSVNIVARKPDKSAPDTNPYMKKLLRQIGWQPREVAVFAGRLDYPSYSFWDRQVIRFIMLLTRGPTDPRAVIDFTDWQQVERFARVLAEM